MSNDRKIDHIVDANKMVEIVCPMCGYPHCHYDDQYCHDCHHNFWQFSSEDADNGKFADLDAEIRK